VGAAFGDRDEQRGYDRGWWAVARRGRRRGDMAAKMGNGVWRGAEGQQGTLAPFLTEPIACSVECGKGNQRKNNRFQHKE
jgi:hypothetical protein